MLFSLLIVACGRPYTDQNGWLALPAPEAAPAPAAPAAPAAPDAASASTPASADCPAAVYGTVPADLGEAMAVDVLRSGTVASGTRVKVKGTIKEVCQKKGCWHTIATSDPAVDLMVKDQEYAIFLPKGCGGHEAEVAGVYTRAVMPIEEARHYAEDAGKDPASVTEAPTKLMLDVEGIAIR